MSGQQKELRLFVWPFGSITECLNFTRRSGCSVQNLYNQTFLTVTCSNGAFFVIVRFPMQANEALKNFLDNGDALFQNVSIDCVIFGFHQNQLKVLVLTFKNTDKRSLPGGFVFKDEGIDEAARRILRERTGLHDIYLEQFCTFGQADRSISKVHRDTMQAVGIELPDDHWVLGRFLSVGYYALVDFSKVVLTTGMLDEDYHWFDIQQIPAMILDHNHITEKALETLRLMLDYKLVAFNLLPDTFTMSELQALYETILDRKMLRANFQRKMLSLEILERVDKKWTGGAHKAPYLYRFDPKRAAALLEGE